MSLSATKPAAAAHAEGHRERLRGRLIEDADGLLDHELIEYLLTLVIPRMDVKPLAKRLLHEFGGIGGLLSASPDSLRRVLKDNDRQVAVIKVAQAAALRLLKADVAAKPMLSNWQALLDYLRADMAHSLVERVRVLHLNTRKVEHSITKLLQAAS